VSVALKKPCKSRLLKQKKVNLVDYKYKKLFKFKSLNKKKAVNGEIGIPRVLNMYENYPLWHTMLTDLGFRVVLSPKSDKELYEKGLKPFHLIRFVILPNSVMVIS
jgi:predicted nucleotide-binding protein (sugar kinase/HSP70/actin superfamily)